MEQEANIARVPPYIPYKTFRTFIEDVREHGLPLRFDAGALGRFSGSTRTQLVSGLRFLGLINENNEPQPDLPVLAEADEPEEWKLRLANLLREAYRPIMELDLARITPSHLIEEFKRQYNSKDDVTRKCVTFFLHAAKDAGLELSPRVLKFTRSAPSRRVIGAKKKADPDAKGSAQQTLPETGGSQHYTGGQDFKTPPDVSRTPIALGPGRLAYIELPNDWKPMELKKLLKLLELSLGEDVEV